MPSPTLTDKQLERTYGRRPTGCQSFDQPQELGYRCPKKHRGDWLAWSEFKDHIWCFKCKRDYHYAADCQLKRMCWMSSEQWNDFVAGLPIKPKIVKGIQYSPDCEIPHKNSKAVNSNV